MNIIEATRLSLETGKYITRKGTPFEEMFKFKPTNTSDCFIIENVDKSRRRVRWNPCAADILCENWELVD